MVIKVPSIGDITDATQLGRRYRGKYIFHACEGCGKTRWVPIKKGIPESVRCRVCVHENHHATGWKCGRHIDSNGYIHIYTERDNPYYSMANVDHYISEHRLVMAGHLDRCLQSWEIVHHLNGIKDDNRIENLQLVTGIQHKQITVMQSEIKHLQDRVIALEAKIVLLRGNIGSYTDS